MSNAVFPLLPGLMWEVKRTPLWSTKVQRSVGGKEVRAAFYSNPIWSYQLSYEFLRDGNAAQVGFNELQTLQAFFLQRQGAFDSFLFKDPNDNYVAGHGFGVGDGVTVGFQLQRCYQGMNQQDYWSGAKTSQFTTPRTNLALYSQDFTNAVWTKTNLTDDGLCIAPDGTYTARRYTATGNATLAQTVAGLVPGQQYTDSVWMRCDLGASVKLGTTEGVGVANAITSAWGQAQQTFTASGASTVLTIGAGGSIPNGTIIEVWENQMELGAVDTPNITTTAAPATVTPKYWPLGGDGFEPVYNLNPSALPSTSPSYFDPSYIDPSYAGGTSSSLQVYVNGALKVNGVDYTVNSAGFVTFTVAPPAGAMLTWTGAYYWRVRFAQDEAEFSNFMQGLWELKTIELVSVK